MDDGAGLEVKAQTAPFMQWTSTRLLAIFPYDLKFAEIDIFQAKLSRVKHTMALNVSYSAPSLRKRIKKH